MLLAFLLAAGIAITLPLAAFIVRRRRDWSAFSTSELKPAAADIDTWTTKGGLWVGPMAMSWPLASLEVSSRTIHIDTGGFIAPRVLSLDRQDVERVRLQRGLLGVGIHFERADHQADGVTFWVLTRHDVETALRDRGWLRDD